jgi:hypothetical protein
MNENMIVQLTFILVKLMSVNKSLVVSFSCRVYLITILRNIDTFISFTSFKYSDKIMEDHSRAELVARNNNKEFFKNI